MIAEINDGGPAFPRVTEYDSSWERIHDGAEGMSLRDWFAGQALSQIGNEYVARGQIGRQAQEHAMAIAAHAYNIADAMIAARKRVI